jgi:hypothetical protein
VIENLKACCVQGEKDLRVAIKTLGEGLDESGFNDLGWGDKLKLQILAGKIDRMTSNLQLEYAAGLKGIVAELDKVLRKNAK